MKAVHAPPIDGHVIQTGNKMPHPSSRISGIVPSGKDGWEVHFAGWRASRPARTSSCCRSATMISTRLRDRRGLRDRGARRPSPLHAASRHPGPARSDGQGLDARHRRRHHGRQVIATPGGQAALYAAVQGVLDPGDHAVVVAPYYATYPGTFRAAGADFTVVEAARRGRFPAARRGDREGADAEDQGDPAQHAEQPDRRGLFARRARRRSPRSAAATISGCSPTRSTGRWAAASMSRRARSPAWPSARWSSTRCRRATA